MMLVRFWENNTVVLSQLRQSIPTIEEAIKIKGKKGKVTEVKKFEENKFDVKVEFEKIVIKQPIVSDKRRGKR